MCNFLLQRLTCTRLLVSYRPLAPTAFRSLDALSGCLATESRVAGARTVAANSPSSAPRSTAASREKQREPHPESQHPHKKRDTPARQRQRWQPPDRQYVWPRPCPSRTCPRPSTSLKDMASSAGRERAQLQSFAQTLSEECEDQTPEPPSQNPRGAGGGTSGRRTRITRSWRPLFRGDQKRRAQARGARATSGTRPSKREDASGSAGCATSRAPACVQMLSPRSCCGRRPRTRRSRPSSPRASGGFLAEADALTAQKTRDELERD